MPIYNTTNITGFNLYDISFGLSQLDSRIFVAILAGFFLIIYAGSVSKFGSSQALLAASFATAIMTLFFRPINLISDNFLTIMISLTAIMAAALVFQRK